MFDSLSSGCFLACSHIDSAAGWLAEWLGCSWLVMLVVRLLAGFLAGLLAWLRLCSVFSSLACFVSWFARRSKVAVSMTGVCLKPWDFEGAETGAVMLPFHSWQRLLLGVLMALVPSRCERISMLFEVSHVSHVERRFDQALGILLMQRTRKMQPAVL